MANLEESSELKYFEKNLQEKAQELVNLLNIGDFTSAMGLLGELSDARNAVVYQEVGRLTRGVHEAIKDFNIDVEQSAAFRSFRKKQESGTSDANARLNYVLELTESAANSTMDLVDACVPVAEELGDQARLLRNDWKKMADAQPSMSEIKDLGRTTEAFLQEIETSSDILQKNFTEILLAQGFQDISGQLIKKVIGLVTDVEKSLVTLVRVAGQVDRITGTKRDLGSEFGEEEQETLAEEDQSQARKGFGPQMDNEKKKDDVVSDQDEVDDLLSSLGF